MKEILNKIRIPDKNMKIKYKIIIIFLIFILGIILGIFSKWLDNMSIDDMICWQHVIGILDLRNVFSLFGIWYFNLEKYNRYNYFYRDNFMCKIKKYYL